MPPLELFGSKKNYIVDKEDEKLIQSAINPTSATAQVPLGKRLQKEKMSLEVT